MIYRCPDLDSKSHEFVWRYPSPSLDLELHARWWVRVTWTRLPDICQSRVCKRDQRKCTRQRKENVPGLDLKAGMLISLLSNILQSKQEQANNGVYEWRFDEHGWKGNSSRDVCSTHGLDDFTSNVKEACDGDQDQVSIFLHYFIINVTVVAPWTGGQLIWEKVIKWRMTKGNPSLGSDNDAFYEFINKLRDLHRA